MVEKTVSVVPQYAGSVGRVREHVSAQSVEDLPVEVVVLLEVFARIEARRQARLRDERQMEVV